MGSGFAKDAEHRNRQNRSLRERSKNIYFQHKNYSVRRKDSLNYKKASPEELRQIRAKIKKQQKRTTIITLVVGSVMLSLLTYFFFFHHFH